MISMIINMTCMPCINLQLDDTVLITAFILWHSCVTTNLWWHRNNGMNPGRDCSLSCCHCRMSHTLSEALFNWQNVRTFLKINLFLLSETWHTFTCLNMNCFVISRERILMLLLKACYWCIVFVHWDIVVKTRQVLALADRSFLLLSPENCKHKYPRYWSGINYFSVQTVCKVDWT